MLLTGARLGVIPLPDTLMPDPDTHVGADFTARPGDVLLRGRIFKTETSTLDAPIKVSIDRFSDTLDAAAELTPVIAPAETRALIGGRGIYYCGRNQRTRSAFVDALIGGMGSKFEAIVRFCFVDSDSDGKLDHVFLAGAKDKALQAPVAIEPTAFHTTYLKPMAESEVTLQYRKFSAGSGKIELELHVRHAGVDEPFDYIIAPHHGTNNRQYRLIDTNPKKLAYPMHFTDLLGADVGIEKVDADGTATFRVNKPFAATMFRPYSIQVQTIYVYIYHG